MMDDDDGSGTGEHQLHHRSDILDKVCVVCGVWNAWHVWLCGV